MGCRCNPSHFPHWPAVSGRTIDDKKQGNTRQARNRHAIYPDGLRVSAQSECESGTVVMVQDNVISRADGVTAAERYLKALCDHSFLSLWSYPGVYRDQGQTSAGRDGKEVCDLLVVFEDHIIIFSDKDCTFPNTGNLDLDWGRWYRRAIEKSAAQVWGAERWIKTYPNRLFLDRACATPFPIDVPDPATATYHRIVVAHDASRRCREAFGGSGSLVIEPGIIGAQHLTCHADGGKPLTIGQIDPAKGFVHVLDDTSLEIVMLTLDTITDFVSYLSRKEAFIVSGCLGWAAGEEDLLAYYLRNTNKAGEHYFPSPPAQGVVFLDEGLWGEFERHPQRLAQVEADAISYAWDALIETFSTHAFARTQYFTTHPDMRDQERMLRFLARESRTRRRMLACLLHEFIAQTPNKDYRAARIILPSHSGDPHYVFLLLSEPEGRPYDEYREVRRELLAAYCRVVKLRFPDAMDVVGIATETGTDDRRSEDTVYLDARTWTEQDQVQAERFVADLGLLREITRFSGVEREYPELPIAASKSAGVPARSKRQG